MYRQLQQPRWLLKSNNGNDWGKTSSDTNSTNGDNPGAASSNCDSPVHDEAQIEAKGWIQKRSHFNPVGLNPGWERDSWSAFLRGWVTLRLMKYHSFQSARYLRDWRKAIIIQLAIVRQSSHDSTKSKMCTTSSELDWTFPVAGHCGQSHQLALSLPLALQSTKQATPPARHRPRPVRQSSHYRHQRRCANRPPIRQYSSSSLFNLVAMGPNNTTEQ